MSQHRRLPRLLPGLSLALIAIAALATAQQSSPKELCSTNFNVIETMDQSNVVMPSIFLTEGSPVGGMGGMGGGGTGGGTGPGGSMGTGTAGGSMGTGTGGGATGGPTGGVTGTTGTGTGMGTGTGGTTGAGMGAGTGGTTGTGTGAGTGGASGAGMGAGTGGTTGTGAGTGGTAGMTMGPGTGGTTGTGTGTGTGGTTGTGTGAGTGGTAGMTMGPGTGNSTTGGATGGETGTPTGVGTGGTEGTTNTGGGQQMVDLSGWTLGFINPLTIGAANASNATGSPVGNLTSTCFVMSPDEGLDYCTCTMNFGSFGGLTFMGPYYDNPNATFTNAIVGGTGIFNGASGSVNVTVLEAGSRWGYNVQLQQKPNCSST